MFKKIAMVTILLYIVLSGQSCSKNIDRFDGVYYRNSTEERNKVDYICFYDDGTIYVSYGETYIIDSKLKETFTKKKNDEEYSAFFHEYVVKENGIEFEFSSEELLTKREIQRIYYPYSQIVYSEDELDKEINFQRHITFRFSKTGDSFVLGGTTSTREYEGGRFRSGGVGSLEEQYYNFKKW